MWLILGFNRSIDSKTHSVTNSTWPDATSRRNAIYNTSEGRMCKKVKYVMLVSINQSLNHISPSLICASKSRLTVKFSQPSTFSITNPFSLAKCNKQMKPYEVEMSASWFLG
jgi:hypothetical protein